MKKLLLSASLWVAGLLIVCGGYSQCPFAVTLTSSGNCPGAMLTLTTNAYLLQIVWLNGTTVVSTTTTTNGQQIHTGSVGYYATLPGSYTASLSDTTGCTVTTPAVIIYPALTADLTISASATTICEDSAIIFTAMTTSGGFVPFYQWRVNKIPVGDNSPTYADSHLANGDQVSCLMTNAAGSPCVLAPSGSIAVTVNPRPHVDSEQVLSFHRGQSLILDAMVTGAVNSYAWSPSMGLSDTTVEHPVASPSQSTTYTLKVTSLNGCKASGTIALKLLIPIRLPNAFTPNGDGRNDVLYLNGELAISRIRDFSIFNRWGQKVFQVHDAPTGDPSFGWNGTYKGHAAPSGTYVYTITVQFTDGSRQTLQGTVILIR
ncbi:MAG TPA: gliding motility-associated C-terminal domain-containing protein [Puia sp.]